MLTSSPKQASNLLWLHRECRDVRSVGDALAVSRTYREGVRDLERLNYQLAQCEAYTGWSSSAQKEQATLAIQADIDACTAVVEKTRHAGQSLAVLKRESSEDKVLGFVMLELMKLNERLHLNNPMTEADIEFVAEDIVRDYPMLTIADLTVIIDDICRGKYGQFYERLNASKILPCFAKYLDERMNAAEAHTLKEHEANKSRVPDLSNLTAQELAQRLADGWKAREEAEAKKREEEAEARKEFVKYKFGVMTNGIQEGGAQ